MTEETAVTVPNGAELDIFAKPGEAVTVGRDVAAVRGLTPENLRPGDKGVVPRAGLSHKLNPEKNRKPGHWYETILNGCYENPEVVFLIELKDRGQILWPEVFDPGNQPLCYSDTGEVPAEPSERRPMTERRTGQRCYVPGKPEECCPDAQWTRVKGADDIPPRCKYMRKWIVAMILPSGIEVVQMQFHGTALKAVKELTNKLIRVGLTQSFILGARYATDGKDYWTPVFAEGQRLGDAGIIRMAQLADMYQAEFASGDLRAETSIEYDDEDAIPGEYTTADAPPPPPEEEAEIPF